MALESLTGTVYIDSLNSANPVGATDPKSEGDDHIRGIKNVLKLSFPNITGAMTATQTELNVLDGQVGGFLLTGSATGGGTADAITATFSPAITLTNGTTVIVRAVGANTVTTPTFNANSLGAKTIVKNSNAALAIGDIAGASHELVLKYNSTNDNWSLLNPANTSRSTFVNYSGGEPLITTSAFDIDASIAEAAWEEVGPTGATNVWTALDSVPTDVSWVEVKIVISCSTSAVGDGNITATIGARKNGSAAAFDSETYIAIANARETSPAIAVGEDVAFAKIPVSSRKFDMYWSSNYTTNSFNMYLVGYGYN